jgi:hypothetical protein
VLQLTLGAATAEAVAALRSRGVRAILIKGPTLARWLYDDPVMRTYGDIDLLVAPDQFAAAEAVLAELGYENKVAGLRSSEKVWSYEHCWARAGGRPSSIDLHRSLFWDSIDPELAWSIVSEQTEVIELCGTPVKVPGAAQRLLLLVLHAAGDGPGNAKGLADLERALARCDEPLWRTAAAMAERLGAGDAFTAGLGLTPGGAVLTRRLGLGSVTAFEVRLRSAGSPITTYGFERLSAQRSVLPRLRFLVGEMFPSRAFIRDWRPLARRGRLGMLAIYLWRPLWLAAMAPRGAWVWAGLRRRPQ